MNGPSKPHKKHYKEARLGNMRPRQTIEIQESRMQGQESRIRVLERRLAYYDNASTPPSHNALSREARPRQRRRAGRTGRRRGTGGHPQAQAHQAWDAHARGVPAMRLRRPGGHGHGMNSRSLARH